MSTIFSPRFSVSITTSRNGLHSAQATVELLPGSSHFGMLELCMLYRAAAAYCLLVDEDKDHCAPEVRDGVIFVESVTGAAGEASAIAARLTQACASVVRVAR